MKYGFIRDHAGRWPVIHLCRLLGVPRSAYYDWLYAGELEIVTRPPRRPNVRVVLMMDVGGSMRPFKNLVDTLFSAAHQARHLKRFDYLYFYK